MTLTFLKRMNPMKVMRLKNKLPEVNINDLTSISGVVYIKNPTPEALCRGNITRERPYTMTNPTDELAALRHFTLTLSHQ